VTHTLCAMKSESTADRGSHRWTEVCGNPECETGWLQLFRSRSLPHFEGKWACSARCMERIIAAAVRSQIESWEPGPAARSLRMPLGLILLSRGWITHRELQEALAAQRCTGIGRIGEWLGRLHGISEATITKALGIQWNCAVVRSGTPGIEFAPSLIPAFLCCRYGLALLRQGPATILYLAGRYCAEHAASRAVEHMLGIPVQAAFLEDGAWNAEALDCGESVESYAGRDGVAASVAELVERSRPMNARLVRIHDHLWLRMWLRRRECATQLQDAVFPLRTGMGKLRRNDAFLRGC
jgi:hypothetical protein